MRRHAFVTESASRPQASLYLDNVAASLIGLEGGDARLEHVLIRKCSRLAGQVNGGVACLGPRDLVDDAHLT